MKRTVGPGDPAGKVESQPHHRESQGMSEPSGFSSSDTHPCMEPTEVPAWQKGVGHVEGRRRRQGSGGGTRTPVRTYGRGPGNCNGRAPRHAGLVPA